jgi:transposase
VINGAMDGSAFAAYVEKVLIPELEPGYCRHSRQPGHTQERHRSQGDARRRMLVPVPAALSPNLNPIELASSKLKAHLRRISARTFTDMFEAIAEVCDLYSPGECWNYSKAAGYVSG